MDERTLEMAIKTIRDMVSDGNCDAAEALCQAELRVCEPVFKHRLLAQLAWVNWKKGHNLEALSLIKEAHLLDPAWAGHLHRLALWLLELARYDEAIGEADRLLDLENRRNSIAFQDAARFIKAFAAYKQGDRAKAASWASEISESKPVWLIDRLISRDDLLKSALN